MTGIPDTTSKAAAEDGASYSDDIAEINKHFAMRMEVLKVEERVMELERTLRMVISAIPHHVKAGMSFTLAEAERTLKGGE